MNTRGVPTYYDILGVSPSVGPEVIESAFRARVREVRDQPGGGDLTRQLGIAYRALKDPDKRRSYDAALAGTPLPRADRPTPKPAFFATGATAAAVATGGMARSSGETPPAPPLARSPRPDPSVAVPPAVPPEPARSEPVPQMRTLPPAEPELPPPAAEPVSPLPPEAVAPRSIPIAERQELPASAPLSPPPPPVEEFAAREPAFQEEEPAGTWNHAEYADEAPPLRRRNNRLPAFLALVGVGLLALMLLLFNGRTGNGTGPRSAETTVAQAGRPDGASGSASGQIADISQDMPPAPGQEGGALPVQPTVQNATPVPVPGSPGSALLGGDELAPDPTTDEAPANSGAAEPEQAVARGGDDAANAPEQTQPAPETAAAAAPPAPRVSRATPARYLGGGLVDSDNAGGRFAGSVGVRFTVLPNGRAGGCRVSRSSGNPSLDATTCNLLQQRLRFTPALDEDGRPIAAEVSSLYTWGRTPRQRR